MSTNFGSSTWKSITNRNKHTSCRVRDSHSQMCIVLKHKDFYHDLDWKPVNFELVPSSKREKGTKESGGSTGSQVWWLMSPWQVHRTDPTSAEEESRHLEMGRGGNYSTQRLLSCSRKSAGKLTVVVSIKRWWQVRERAWSPDRLLSSSSFSPLALIWSQSMAGSLEGAKPHCPAGKMST